MKRRKNMPGRNMLLPAIMTACILTLGAGSCAAGEAGNGHAPDWAKNAVLYEVNVRQYTPEGTFAAFSEHLEELKDMGIDTLWFMPIHPISETNRAGTLGSYYSVFILLLLFKLLALMLFILLLFLKLFICGKLLLLFF